MALVACSGGGGSAHLAEDFPLSAHVRYEPGARVIAQPVSVDLHKGAVTVVDEGGAAAAIEVADELRHAPQDVRYPPEVLKRAPGALTASITVTSTT
jgi:hypothetical protein